MNWHRLRRIPAIRRPVRCAPLRFEILEARALLDATAQFFHVEVPPPGSQDAADGTPLTAGYSQPTGLTPTEIRHAYGIDSIAFNGLAGNGTGQTIAIIDVDDTPSLVSSSDGTFNTSDLHKFDVAMGLSDPPKFTKVSQTGSPTSLPSASGTSGWSRETCLDVEWAHAVAPSANILLVEANSASSTDLNAAVVWAANQPGVSVISMSYGFSESSGETSYDNTVYVTPPGHAGITFVASTGDTGSPGTYPAFSPNVVAVGGTSLTCVKNSGQSNDGTYTSETAWSDSGGGTSTIEAKPSYQPQSSTYRQAPDVAFDADPNTGVTIYDSYDYGPSTPWMQMGGTSLAAPCWAGLVAIANQLRASQGLPAMNGVSATLQALYRLPSGDFHDITSGSNGGFSAGTGYDEVTGLGSPVANQLVPDLAFYQTLLTTTAQPAVATGTNSNSTVLYHFTDSINTNTVPANYSATITWGDGSPTASGTIVACEAGGFDVLGSHAYSQNVTSATFSVQVMGPNGFTATSTNSALSVGNAPIVLTSTMPSLRAVTGQALTRTVATFFDPAGAGPLANYSATINWGDGTPATNGTITLNSGVFTVQAGHTYTQNAGSNDTVTVTIVHNAAPPVTFTVSATIVGSDSSQSRSTSPIDTNWADGGWTNSSSFPNPDDTVNVTIPRSRGTTNVNGNQLAHSLTINAGSNVTVDGGSSLTVSGSVTLSAGGTASVLSGGTLGLAGLTGTGSVTLDGGTLAAGGTFSSAIPITIQTGGGTVNTAGNNVTLTGNLTPATSSTGGLTKAGSGTLALSGTNTYEGATTVIGGTLVASSPTALPSATSFSVAAGATLVLLGGSMPTNQDAATTVAATMVVASAPPSSAATPLVSSPRIPVLIPPVSVQSPAVSATSLAAGSTGVSAVNAAARIPVLIAPVTSRPAASTAAAFQPSLLGASAAASAASAAPVAATRAAPVTALAVAGASTPANATCGPPLAHDAVLSVWPPTPLPTDSAWNWLSPDLRKLQEDWDGIADPYQG
jgi:autotransporter-associated beta strand protein